MLLYYVLKGKNVHVRLTTRNGVWEAIDTILEGCSEDVLLHKNNSSETPVELVIQEALVYCLPSFAKKGMEEPTSHSPPLLPLSTFQQKYEGDAWLTGEANERIRTYRDSDGFSLLHSAASENSIEAVQFCLKVVRYYLDYPLCYPSALIDWYSYLTRAST